MLTNYSDIEVERIWNSLAHFCPVEGWHSPYDESTTWQEWLELVYSECLIRGIDTGLTA